MNNDKLIQTAGGGVAMGAAIAVWLTHGGNYSPQEVASIAAGIGAALTYFARVVERCMKWR